MAEQVFPGAAFAFGTVDSAWIGAVGKLEIGPEGSEASATTLYDLASLTKVLVTTTSAMCFFQDGVLDLEMPVQEVVPSFTGIGKEDVTIRHLLTHHSGLPAVREYWRTPGARGDLICQLLAEPLVRQAGTAVEYSCVGFLVLQQVLQAITGERYDDAWTWPFFRISNLNGWEFRFNPGPEVLYRCAPTELDLVSGEFIRGKVHDENARVLGGIAGNAGLFGTVKDVASFAQMILRGGDGFLDSSMVEQWTSRQLTEDALSTRGLGWDTRTEVDSSAGTKMGPLTFGHLGFTGTSLWVDPASQRFVILLSNRVHPSREGPSIRPWRAGLADLAYSLMDRDV